LLDVIEATAAELVEEEKSRYEGHVTLREGWNHDDDALTIVADAFQFGGVHAAVKVGEDLVTAPKVKRLTKD
jgi:hypothetical protein